MAAKPLIMTPVPKADIMRGQGAIVTEFIQRFCRITKESLGGSAGTLLQMRNWQINTIGCVYARRPDGRFRHRQALIGLPRKNGKSAIGSSMGLHGLIMGDYGSEVYSCAADKDQARIVFNVAKRMVEMDPELSAIIKVTRDALEYTEKGSIYKVISSEAFTKEGLNPTVIVYDELHAAPTDELYNVMSLAQGSRKNPLMIAITTAGVKTDQTGQDSICYRLYQQGCRIAAARPEDVDYEQVFDPTFFMAWWGAKEGADYKDPKVWEDANPGYNDLIDPEDFSSVIKRVHENEFRTKRLNQWVSSVKAWLPQGSWDACRSDREFSPNSRGVVLGFDGSQNNDTTALVAVSIAAEPQVTLLGLWEKPRDIDKWQVPREEVKDMIRKSCRDFRDAKTPVREIACDEYIWHDALDELTTEGLPVVVFPQTLTMMAPATQRTYEMVVNRKITHDGNPTLKRHFDNCQLKIDTRGSRIVKDKHNSPRKIDSALATVMAIDRAAFWLSEPAEGEMLDAYGNRHVISDIQFVWGDGDAGGFVTPGEKCAKCGCPVIKWPDGSPRLVRIGLQVVCTPPCAGTNLNQTPEPPKEATGGTYDGFMVN